MEIIGSCSPESFVTAQLFSNPKICAITVNFIQQIWFPYKQCGLIVWGEMFGTVFPKQHPCNPRKIT